MQVDDRIYAMSTEDIAAELGVSKQRVSAIIDRALWKLRRSRVLRDFADCAAGRLLDGREHSEVPS